MSKFSFEQFSPKQLATDTGSSESQIAIYTHRIEYIHNHLKKNRKDNSARYSLRKKVEERKKQLSYLKTQDIKRYQAICAKLSLRK